MRKFINIIETILTEARASNLPAEGIQQGDFIQLIGWFGDVWAYVESTYGVDTDEQGHPKQSVSYSRCGNYGEANFNGSHFKPTEFAIFGNKIDSFKGGLMYGQQCCNLRKVATQAEIRQKIAGGESLILAMPQFKIDGAAIWRDGEHVGQLDRKCMMNFRDGSQVDMFDPSVLTPRTKPIRK